MPPFAVASPLDLEDLSLLGEVHGEAHGEAFVSVETPKKCVRIDLEFNEVCEIPHVDEMSKQQIADMWFSRAESTMIRDSLLGSIARLNNEEQEHFDETNDTTRGLEYFSYNGALRRECNKLRLRRAVLDEQQRQREHGECDAYQLACVAAECARECTQQALGIAEQDEYSAYDDDNDDNDDDMEEYEEQLLLKRAASLRPALSLCCWDFGLLCLKRWR